MTPANKRAARLRSPKLPLLEPGHSLISLAHELSRSSAVALRGCPAAARCACRAPTTTFIAHSAIEPRAAALAVRAAELAAPRAGPKGRAVQLYQPHEIYVEKALFDAFKPLNATISAALAFVPALLGEAVTKGWIPEPSLYLAEDPLDAPDETPGEPLDWDMVAQVTAITFARETTSSTLQRAAEMLTKPRAPDWVYQGMIRHVPRMARAHYRDARETCSSLTSCRSTSAQILASPIFYISKYTPIAIADVAWDIFRCLLPKGYKLRLEPRKFRSNARLKLCKHALCCGLAYCYGALIPFAWSHPLAFILSDLAATLAADLTMGQLGLPLPL